MFPLWVDFQYSVRPCCAGKSECPQNATNCVPDLVSAKIGVVMVMFVQEHLSNSQSEATVGIPIRRLFYLDAGISQSRGSQISISGAVVASVFVGHFEGLASNTPRRLFDLHSVTEGQIQHK